MFIGCAGGQYSIMQADVGCLSYNITYLDGTAGPNGVPAAWPGGSGSPHGQNFMLCIQPDYNMLIAGSLDAAIKSYLGGSPGNPPAPPGSLLTCWQEGNYGPNFAGTPAQFAQMHTHLYNLVHSMGYPVLVGQKFATFPTFQSGQNLTPYIAAGMDWYGLDGYAAKYQVNPGNVPSPKDIFEPARQYILAINPQARIGITETNNNSSSDLSSISRMDWFNMCYRYACDTSMWGLFYFGQAGSPNDYTTDQIGQQLWGQICKLEAQRNVSPWL